MSHLALHSICKEFEEYRVLHEIKCTFESEVVALMGPNGAGKSTLLNILSTQMRPSSGYFALADLDSEHHENEIRSKVGMIGHQSYLYPSLTVRENLLFYARLYQVQSPHEVILTLTEQFSIADRLARPVRELSRGLLQRVSLVRALLHSPSMLLFDEPFTGLDTHSSEKLLHELFSWRSNKQKLLLLTTHNFHRASECADRFLFLSRGRIVLDYSGTMSFLEIEEQYSQSVI